MLVSIYMILLILPLPLLAFSFAWTNFSGTTAADYDYAYNYSRSQSQSHSHRSGSSSTSMSTSSAPSSASPAMLHNISKIHIIVLVHGWLGNPKEMEYLKQSLARQARHLSRTGVGRGDDTSVQENQDVDVSASNPIQVAIDVNDAGADADADADADAVDVSDKANKQQQQQQQQQQQLFVIHSAECNSGTILTSDGIAAGGRRLATEIDQLISQYTQPQTEPQPQPQPQPQITISLVGNSLGGLYCRYAVSAIQALQSKSGSGSVQVQVQAQPKLFVTTCTPHLGVSQHTFVTLPTWVESPIARIMQQTGADLFRRSNIIQDMTTHHTFLKPLLAFERRIAYANVLGTDFQVPTATAAFWADTKSLHFKKDFDFDFVGNGSYEQHNIVMQLETPQQMQEAPTSITTSTPSPLPPAINNFLSSKELSTRLDQLGWTKVLVDVRHHLPLSRRFSPLSERQDGRLTPDSKWTATELLQEFDRDYFRTLPLGHTVMVANAKDSLNQYLTQGGKPTMDYLAATMIEQLIRSDNDGEQQ